MIARQTTQAAIEQAATTTGVRIDNIRPANKRGDAFAFVLRLGPAKLYQRFNYQLNRRVAAVCWHGHAAFFRELFKLSPTATVHTSRMGDIRYTAENFERTYGPTGDANIGSQMKPCAFRDACDYDSHPINQ